MQLTIDRIETEQVLLIYYRIATQHDERDSDF